MMENADALYRDEVSNACETLEGLTETAAEDRERIAALSVAFTEMVGVMKGHEVDESTGRRECAVPVVCACPLNRVVAGGPDNLVERLDGLANVLEGTKFRFDDSKTVNPLAGAQQRRWYDKERPEVVEALRKHRDAIASLVGTETKRPRRSVTRRRGRPGGACGAR